MADDTSDRRHDPRTSRKGPSAAPAPRPSGGRALRRALAGAAAAWAVLGGLTLVAVIAVTLANVGAVALDGLMRPFGGAVGGLPGYEDFVRLAVSGAAPSFLPWCQQQRGHVAADLFVSRLPRGLGRALDRFWLAALVALCAFLGWTMAQGMAEARADGALSPVLGWPEWPFYAPGVASLVLWGLVAAAQIVDPSDPAPAHG